MDRQCSGMNGVQDDLHLHTNVSETAHNDNSPL